MEQGFDPTSVVTDRTNSAWNFREAIANAIDLAILKSLRTGMSSRFLVFCGGWVCKRHKEWASAMWETLNWRRSIFLLEITGAYAALAGAARTGGQNRHVHRG